MKTDDLIGLLAADDTPVPRHAGERRLALALASGTVLTLAWIATAYGLRTDLPQLVLTGGFWAKLAAPLAVAALAARVVHRMAHPGVRIGGAAAWMLVLPVLLLWLWALVVWLGADAAARPALLWGQTWRTCVFSITIAAVPAGIAAFWALRGLAPTRPALTGAAAGWMAGGVGAAVYALHCPETAAPFLAVWYVLGMLVPAGLGALAGARGLRW